MRLVLKSPSSGYLVAETIQEATLLLQVYVKNGFDEVRKKHKLSTDVPSTTKKSDKKQHQ